MIFSALLLDLDGTIIGPDEGITELVEKAIRKVAEQVGTPFYLYSHATLTRHFSVFDQAFELTGDETDDVVLHVTFSNNDSFEWEDDNGDDKWQPFEESVVDMGLRGMNLSVE